MVNIARVLFGLDKSKADEDQEIIDRLDKIASKLESSEEE